MGILPGIFDHSRLVVVAVEGESLILKRSGAIVIGAIVTASRVPMHVRSPAEMYLIPSTRNRR